MQLSNYQAGQFETQYQNFLPAAIHHDWLVPDAQILQLSEITGQRRNRLFIFLPYFALFRKPLV